MRTLTTVILLATGVVAGAPDVRAQELTRDEARRLLPEAAGLNARTWQRIAQAPEPPRVRSFEQFPLTVMFLLQRWAPMSDPAFRFLGEYLPSPGELAPSWQRSLRRGFVSFFQAEDLHEIRLEPDGDGDDVRGTCRFRLDGLYEGALRFDARREGGRWTITRLELPALGLRSTLVDGRWRGAGAILSLAWVRQELGFAFAPGVDRETFETWKRPGRRPELDALSGPTPGDALLTRSCAPRPDSTWRFFRGEAPPSLEHLEAVLEERGRRGLATFVTPGEVSRLRLSAAGADREEVMATAELRAARGAFAVRVDGLMEGEGTFEARYVTPDHLPGGLEGAWVLHALELPGLGWRFEREADHHTWRVVPRSGERGQ